MELSQSSRGAGLQRCRNRRSGNYGNALLASPVVSCFVGFKAPAAHRCAFSHLERDAVGCVGRPACAHNENCFCSDGPGTRRVSPGSVSSLLSTLMASPLCQRIPSRVCQCLAARFLSACRQACSNPLQSQRPQTSLHAWQRVRTL